MWTFFVELWHTRGMAKKEQELTVLKPEVEKKRAGASGRTKIYIKKTVDEIKQAVTIDDYRAEKAAKKRKGRIIYWSVVGVLIVLFFTAGTISSAIFSEEARITEILSQSSLDVSNIGNFFSDNIDSFIRALSTLFLVFLIIKFCWIVIRLASLRASNRRKTILALLYSFIKYTGIVVMFFVFLGIVMDVGTTLAGLGVMAIVIGFGAQSLLADIIAGLFIVFENAFEVGDIITFNGIRGEVTYIGIRTTKIKGVDGNVFVINNSELRQLVNMTQHRSVAVCDLTISYDENLEKVEALLESFLPTLMDKHEAIKEEPSYLGPAEFNQSGVVLRIIAEVDEADRMRLTRALNREFKLLFDKHKIKLSVPHVQVKSGGK